MEFDLVSKMYETKQKQIQQKVKNICLLNEELLRMLDGWYLSQILDIKFSTIFFQQFHTE